MFYLLGQFGDALIRFNGESSDEVKAKAVNKSSYQWPVLEALGYQVIKFTKEPL